MLLTYSKNLADSFSGVKGDWRESAVLYAAQLAKVQIKITWARRCVDGLDKARFTLPGAGNKEHDAFINAVYGLDPDARIETARAIFEDCSDWLSQKAARV